MNEKFYLDNENGRFCELKEKTKDIQLKCENKMIESWIAHALSKVGYKLDEAGELTIVFNQNRFRIEGGSEFDNLGDLLSYLKLR